MDTPWSFRGLAGLAARSVLWMTAFGLVFVGIILVTDSRPSAAPPPAGAAEPWREFELSNPPARKGRPAPELGPHQFVVPSLKVDSRWVKSGLDNGAFVLPSDDLSVVASMRLGGVRWIAGHVNYNGVTGALAPLSQIRPGARIYVSGGRDAPVRTYAVRVLKSVPKAPIDAAALGARRGDLVVVTCGGAVLAVPDGNGGVRHTYADNVVVVASRIKNQS